MSTDYPEHTPPTREDMAQRDVLIAELTRSQRRLQDLYDIGKVLLRFDTIAQTVPEVVALLARTLPLRSAIFIQTKGALHTLIFQAQGELPQQLHDAKAHARTHYRYLVPSEVELELEQTVLELSSLAELAPPEVGQQLVLLPFVVSGGEMFGALQIASTQPWKELDLVFVSAVVNQLATALDRNAIDRALRASEAKLAGIMSMAADAVITVDETMCIVMYNEGAEKIFGWSRAEVLGKPIELLLPARFGDAHHRHMREFHVAADPARKMGARLPEIFGLRKNGQEFHADAAISKLNTGGVWLFTVILRDISEQRRIEREKAFLVEVSAVLGGSLDNEQTLGNIARLAMRDVADFCVIEFVDERGELRRLEVVSSDPDKAELAKALREFPLDRSRPHLSSRIMESNSSQIIPHVSADTLRSVAQGEEHLRLFEGLGLRTIMGVPLNVGGRLVGALIVASCRSERRYGPADLQLLAEVGQRAALALENARLYRVAQRAVQVRDDVLGVVAHDLRNPLGSILMQAARLRRKEPEPERRTSKPREVIERAANRMNRLIQDLLDVTSMDAGHLSIERVAVPVRQVLCDLLETQHALAVSRSLELRLDPTPEELQIWADRERLFQVLENLVGNAVKFTANGGRIAVGARLQEADVLFWVTDTGAGIEAGDLPRLFDRFWQVRETARRGAGLGLAIVKGLVESHQGRIWVESTIGIGSSFYFTIPMLRPATNHLTPP